MHKYINDIIFSTNHQLFNWKVHDQITHTYEIFCTDRRTCLRAEMCVVPDITEAFKRRVLCTTVRAVHTVRALQRTGAGGTKDKIDPLAVDCRPHSSTRNTFHQLHSTFLLFSWNTFADYQWIDLSFSPHSTSYCTTVRLQRINETLTATLSIFTKEEDTF